MENELEQIPFKPSLVFNISVSNISAILYFL